MNDIEILEELLSWKGKRVEVVVKDGEITAIENLINSVKELEEENKQLDKEAQGYLEELAGDTTAISILYNKQISRVKELEEIEEEHQKINGELQERIEELEQNYDKLTRHFMENHISKDKIKAKIEYLKQIHKERDFTIKEGYYLDCYKELLEE